MFVELPAAAIAALMRFCTSGEGWALLRLRRTLKTRYDRRKVIRAIVEVDGTLSTVFPALPTLLRAWTALLPNFRRRVHDDHKIGKYCIALRKTYRSELPSPDVSSGRTTCDNDVTRICSIAREVSENNHSSTSTIRVALPRGQRVAGLLQRREDTLGGTAWSV